MQISDPNEDSDLDYLDGIIDFYEKLGIKGPCFINSIILNVIKEKNEFTTELQNNVIKHIENNYDVNRKNLWKLYAIKLFDEQKILKNEREIALNQLVILLISNENEIERQFIEEFYFNSIDAGVEEIKLKQMIDNQIGFFSNNE